MNGFKNALTLVLAFSLMSAGAALACSGVRTTHTTRMVPASFQMMSRFVIPSGNTMSGDVTVLAIASQFEDKTGKVVASCVLKGNPSNAPIELAPDATPLSNNPACLSNELVQPICGQTGLPCRNNKDCAVVDSCTCPAPGTGMAVPFASHPDNTPADKLIADNVLEHGGANVLCYQCRIDLGAAGLAPGDAFSMPTWLNVNLAPIGTLCGPPQAPQGCDGDGDGTKDPVVRTKMFMGNGTIPTTP